MYDFSSHVALLSRADRTQKSHKCQTMDRGNRSRLVSSRIFAPTEPPYLRSVKSLASAVPPFLRRHNPGARPNRAFRVGSECLSCHGVAGKSRGLIDLLATHRWKLVRGKKIAELTARKTVLPTLDNLPATLANP